MAASAAYVRSGLGDEFLQHATPKMESVYADSSRAVPVMFVHFPGRCPLRDVEALARQHGYTCENGRFCHVALGKPQLRPPCSIGSTIIHQDTTTKPRF